MSDSKSFYIGEEVEVSLGPAVSRIFLSKADPTYFAREIYWDLSQIVYSVCGF